MPKPPLELTIRETGGPTLTLADNGPFDTNPTSGVIVINTTLLNPLLNKFTVISLSATSNSPGYFFLSNVSESGTVELIPGSTQV